jgi:hypothetical protein
MVILEPRLRVKLVIAPTHGSEAFAKGFMTERNEFIPVIIYRSVLLYPK